MTRARRPDGKLALLRGLPGCEDAAEEDLLALSRVVEVTDVAVTAAAMPYEQDWWTVVLTGTAHAVDGGGVTVLAAGDAAVIGRGGCLRPITEIRVAQAPAAELGSLLPRLGRPSGAVPVRAPAAPAPASALC